MSSQPIRTPNPAWRVLSALGLLTIGGTVAVVANGCGGDEYRCDNTGCFVCDGYGCRNVEPPPTVPCGFAGDPVCKDKTVCTDIGCLTPCADDAGCEKGLVCKGGFCTPPTKGIQVKKVCTVAKDCPTGNSCIDGACVATPPCTGVSCSCKYSSDCSTDGSRICVDGACAGACDASRPCSTGFVCSEKGVCTLGTPTCGAAAGGATCKATEHCVDGRCTASCTDDASCVGADGKADPGQRCVGGSCVPDTRTHPKCAGDTECASGTQKCLDGFCKYLCTTDDGCLAIDTRIGACSKTEGVCRSPAEVAAKCTSKAQCDAGKDCVDGQCK